MVRYGLVADGLHDPAGLQRVVEEEVVVRRVLVRNGLKEKEKYILIFLFFLQCCGSGIPGSRIRIYPSRMPDPETGVKTIPNPGSASNNLSI